MGEVDFGIAIQDPECYKMPPARKNILTIVVLVDLSNAGD